MIEKQKLLFLQNKRRRIMRSIFNPALFTQYRSVLMGWSIIWIFMFHSKSIGVPIYDDIQK